MRYNLNQRSSSTVQVQTICHGKPEAEACLERWRLLALPSSHHALPGALLGCRHTLHELCRTGHGLQARQQLSAQ